MQQDKISEETTDKSKPGFAVVVPMYQEVVGAELCVRTITRELASLNSRCFLIVVNDGSTDGTREILERHAKTNSILILVHHETNQGYGAALRTGALEAGRLGIEYVLFMDSDLTNPPAHIVRFVFEMEKGIDVIKGCRYCSEGEVIGVPFKRLIISRIGNLIAERLYGIHIQDCTNGFRAVKTDLFLKMPLKENRFNIIMEELYWAKKIGCSFSQVPTTLYNRSIEQRDTLFTYKPKIFWDYMKFAVKAAFI